jgi:ABC-type multidrug transport system ATPase subunit
MSSGAAVITRGLTKRYGAVTAVADLDLDVRQGEVYGFLGRNGAGKTTTIRMMLGLARPAAGEVRILGTRIKRGGARVLGRVGCLVETASAYGNLTVRENLEIQRRLTGSPAAAVNEQVERFGLSAYADRRAGALSLGNKQRLSLARAMLHKPDVLVLDEPANALDPAGIVEVRKLLRSLADGGMTVFMSSHILGEVAQLADRIGIIHRGRLIEELGRRELRTRVRPYVEIRAGDPDRAGEVLSASGFRQIETHEDGFRVFDGVDRAPELARLLVRAGVDVHALTPGREDLEAYFLRLTGGDG